MATVFSCLYVIEKIYIYDQCTALFKSGSCEEKSDSVSYSSK